MVSEATYIERRKCSDKGIARTQNWKGGADDTFVEITLSILGF